MMKVSLLKKEKQAFRTKANFRRPRLEVGMERDREPETKNSGHLVLGKRAPCSH